jgi:hypothetical protein
MKFNIHVVSIVLLSGLAGCYTPPEFPVEPLIEYSDVVFKDIENLPDSLILTIGFQDGNGDLGLSTNEKEPPYNSVWFSLKENGELVTYSDRFTPEYDTLPPYEFPYTCMNYLLNSEALNGEYAEDTLYFQQNSDHWNIFVKFFVKKNGTYTEFDWATAFDPQCSDNFNGRFPLLSDLTNSPLEGKLRYGLTSSGFNFLFRNDTLKLEIYIKDRALNISNLIETPDFTLKAITEE